MVRKLVALAILSFLPITMIADFPLILLVPNSSPAKSVADLVAHAKANADKSTYSSASPSFTLDRKSTRLNSSH